MFPADKIPVPMAVEYTAHGQRVTKRFPDAYAARRFYKVKYLAGKNPKVQRVNPASQEIQTMTANTTSAANTAVVETPAPAKTPTTKSGSAATNGKVNKGSARRLAVLSLVHELDTTKKGVVLAQLIKAAGKKDIPQSTVLLHCYATRQGDEPLSAHYRDELKAEYITLTAAGRKWVVAETKAAAKAAAKASK